VAQPNEGAVERRADSWEHLQSCIPFFSLTNGSCSCLHETLLQAFPKEGCCQTLPADIISERSSLTANVVRVLAEFFRVLSDDVCIPLSLKRLNENETIDRQRHYHLKNAVGGLLVSAR
jgi:hypothetical protein